MSSVFQQMVADDRDRVFLNLSEYGQIYHVDGQDIIAQFNKYSLLRRSDLSALGTGIGEASLICKMEDLIRRPAEDDVMTIDGAKWTVVTVLESMGMYNIRLTRNMQAWQ